MKQFLVALAIGMAAVFSTSSLADQRFGPHLVLTMPCDLEVKGRCPIWITIDGPISKADADALRLILDKEARRTGKRISPVVIISSTGGDVQAAMQIGRDLRRTEGTVLSKDPCYSACVLVAAGAVQRTAFGIGIHRPYFADATTGSLAEADARYKKLMTDVRDYLHEMNMPDEVFQIMENVGPDEIRKLTTKDAQRLGFIGDDPAFEEVQIAAEARRYGLTSAEYRKRQAKIDAMCGKLEDVINVDDSVLKLRRLGECHTQVGEPIMWGVDHDTVELIYRTVRERCKMQPETPPWNECVQEIGRDVKAGLAPTSASTVAKPKLPPDFKCWAYDPDCK